jgi:hypothetical protein
VAALLVVALRVLLVLLLLRLIGLFAAAVIRGYRGEPRRIIDRGTVRRG